MATILASFGTGGSGLYPNQGPPSLATILRDIATDLAGLQGQLSPNGAIPNVNGTSAQAGALTSAQDGALTSSQNATDAAATQTGAYVQADAQSVATLANAIKANYNQAQADLATLRTAYNAAQADIAALRTAYNAAQNDIATIITAIGGKGGAGSYTLLTIAG